MNHMKGEALRLHNERKLESNKIRTHAARMKRVAPLQPGECDRLVAEYIKQHGITRIETPKS